jgi:hypothetical protein
VPKWIRLYYPKWGKFSPVKGDDHISPNMDRWELTVDLGAMRRQYSEDEIADQLGLTPFQYRQLTEAQTSIRAVNPLQWVDKLSLPFAIHWELFHLAEERIDAEDQAAQRNQEATAARAVATASPTTNVTTNLHFHSPPTTPAHESGAQEGQAAAAAPSPTEPATEQSSARDEAHAPRLAKKKSKREWHPRHASFPQVEHIAKGLLKKIPFRNLDDFLERFCREVDEQVEDPPEPKTLRQRWGQKFWSMRRQTKWLNSG